MIVYEVKSVFYDGYQHAEISSIFDAERIPADRHYETDDKDIYFEYFADRAAADRLIESTNI